MKRALAPIALLLIVGGYLSLLKEQQQNFADDPGVGWHLKTGELIAAAREVPRQDPFLAPPQGEAFGLKPGEQRRWVCDQWLSDLAFFEAKEAGGYPLVCALLGGAFLVAFFGAVAPAALNRSGSALLALASAAAAFKLSQVHFIMRPTVLGICLFALVHCAIGSFLSVEAPSVRSVLRSSLVFAALFLLWANIHPSFVQGLLLLLLAFPASLLEGRLTRRRFFGLSALLCTSVAATLCNPQGAGLHRSIVSLALDPYLMRLNNEWRPLVERANIFGVAGALFLFLCVVPLPLSMALRKRMPVGWMYDLLSSALFSLQAIQMVRCLPYAAIASAPLAASAYRQLLAGIAWPSSFGLTRRFVAELERLEGRSPRWAGVALVVGLLGVLSSHRTLAAAGPHVSPFVAEALSHIKGDPVPGAVLASPDLGGRITAALYPQHRAVLDDRNTMLGADIYRSFFGSMRSLEALRQLCSVFGVHYVIFAPRDTVQGEAIASGLCAPVLEMPEGILCRVAPRA